MFNGLTDFQTLCICFFGMISVIGICIALFAVINAICIAINGKTEIDNEEESDDDFDEEMDDDENDELCEDCGGDYDYHTSSITIENPTDEQINKLIENSNTKSEHGFREFNVTINNATQEQIEKMNAIKTKLEQEGV